MSERQILGLPLPVLRDMHGQIIREFDILRVFHFYGRRCGKGRQRHYMYKIAVVKQWTNPRIGRQWWFHHTAEMGEGLTNGYCPYKGSGEQWAVDQTLEGVEVIASPATLRDENEKRRIKPADHSGTRKRKHPGREAKPEGGAA